MHSPLRVVYKAILHLQYLRRRCMLFFVSFNVNIMVALVQGRSASFSV